MGLVAPIAVVCATSACYAPDLRDCSVRCSSARDCAGEQLCSAGFCVSSAEQSCPASSGGNGGGPSTGNVDASLQPAMRDAAIDAAPDAPAHGTLDVAVQGKGSILVQGVGTCVSSCRFTVPLASTITAIAIANDDFDFDAWTAGPCEDREEATCTFVPQLTVALAGKFRKD